MYPRTTGCNKNAVVAKHTTPKMSAIRSTSLRKPRMRQMYNDDKSQIIGQARSSFHLGGLESAYVKTQNSVPCRKREFVFSLGLFNQEKGDNALIGLKSN